MIVATAQAGACVVWALLLWLVGFNPVNMLGLQPPVKQPWPQITLEDVVKALPVGICAAG
eukprot:CAMPEP_0171780200 /NCGR_PEP_ID=MMETSP0991-20121206/59471_1 /TAXON_ID=483369 /ORGANISM="non described non described, Strain CCMP2098" /LENGTH=59 /DNA_ID=CAMNT_0012387531 /DNA_START=20 /DNA_END=195 /DNA_ORIENTATION=-